MTTATPLLLSWDCVESLGDLERLKPCPTRRSSRLSRGAAAAAATTIRFTPCGGPWWPAWLFQHPSIEALLRELNRNPALLDACGFHPVPTRGRRKRPFCDALDAGRSAALTNL